MLNSWKEIAGALKQPIDTVRRWERQEGLPIHRIASRKHKRVFAYNSEIENWMQNRTPNHSGVPEKRRSAVAGQEQGDISAVSKQRELRQRLRTLLDIHRQRMTLLMSTARKDYPDGAKQKAQVEQALSSISKKVIEALEQERTRIGRELHDNINQRLALVIIALDQMQKDASGQPAFTRRIGEIRRQIMEVTTDVHEVAYSLHPAKLEYLGLVAAIRSECKALALRQKMEVQFRSQNVPRALPIETSLCLFRIAQEALHNAASHSEAKHINVQLRSAATDIHLVVSDSGKGFDVRTASGERLGLTSMQERARLLGGTLVIRSKPRAGTLYTPLCPFCVVAAEQGHAGTSVA